MFRLALAAVGVVVSVGSAVAAPADLFAEKVKDFGPTPRGPVVVHYFRFTNTTNQTLTLGQPRVSCGCVSASVSQNTVAPGQSAAVIAQMNTNRAGPAGVLKAVTVYVPFLSPSATEVSLRVQAVIRDDLILSPDTINLGTVRKGAGAAGQTKVTFTTDPNWQVTEATSSGAFVKAEAKLESRAGMVTYVVTASLDKDCPAGFWIADITLKTNNPAVGSVRIPVTVTVSPPVTVSPAALEFGDMPLGSPGEKRVVLQSGTPFRILEVKGGDAQVVVTVEHKDARPVHVVTVSASPRILGGFDRTIEVLTDNPDQPRLVIPLVAKVVGP